MTAEFVSVYLALLYTLTHLNSYQVCFLSRRPSSVLSCYCSDGHKVLWMDLVVPLPSQGKASQSIRGFEFTAVGCIIRFIVWSAKGWVFLAVGLGGCLGELSFLILCEGQSRIFPSESNKKTNQQEPGTYIKANKLKQNLWFNRAKGNCSISLIKIFQKKLSWQRGE